MGEEAKPEQAADHRETEEKKEEPQPQPQPPSPVVLSVDLHCVGCAKKIERTIKKVKGVEGVDIDMAKNQVSIRGILDPQAACDKIMKRTRRKAKLLSPLPPPAPAPAPEATAAPAAPQVIATPQTTVELNVNMHCEACAEQLKRKLLQMRGVQSAETELSSGKVVVTGTMNAEKLVEYVYRRTKKQAKIIPQPEPEKPPADQGNKGDDDNIDQKPPPAAAAAEDQEKEKEKEEPKDHKKEETNGGQKEGEKPPAEEEAKKEEKGGGGEEAPAGGGSGGDHEGVLNNVMIEEQQEESLKRMINYYYQPLYVIERIPPPQLFSDENPNACCIS
ncbi:Heavy metal-associated isoprenylated plant protein 9 [Dionaea muscipula]